MPAEVYNANPTIFATSKTSRSQLVSHSLWIDEADAPRYGESDEVEPIDSDEIFGACQWTFPHMPAFTLMPLINTEHIRHIVDPEHPLTLEQLAVVSAGQVEVNGNHVLVEFTPTVPHCGASTLIGEHHSKFSIQLCT